MDRNAMWSGLFAANLALTGSLWLASSAFHRLGVLRADCSILSLLGLAGLLRLLVLGTAGIIALGVEARRKPVKWWVSVVLASVAALVWALLERVLASASGLIATGLMGLSLAVLVVSWQRSAAWTDQGPWKLRAVRGLWLLGVAALALSARISTDGTVGQVAGSALAALLVSIELAVFAETCIRVWEWRG
ncbi:MAG: hypothetical protein QMC79_10340 [Anaerosomatales bacterium]|nr:hypothetical protein [Anaerosomatales bacterium]